MRLAIFVLATLAAAPAAAQAPPAAALPAQLTEEVTGIRRALDELISMQQTRGRIDLVLKRIELQERRLEPVEQQLRWAEAGVQQTKDELHGIERMSEQYEKQLQEEIRNTTDAPGSDTRRMLADIKRTREAKTERQQEAVLRMRQLEDDLAARRKAIDTLDKIFLELVEEGER